MAAGIFWLRVAQVSLLLLVGLHCAESRIGWKNPETVDPKWRINLVDALAWRELEPKSLLIRFDQKQIAGKMTFSLLGYSERNVTKISKLHLPFTMLASQQLPDTVQGELDVMKLQLSCGTKDEECNLYDMGFIQITGEMSVDLGHAVTLISPIVPLGWFIQPLFKKANFPNWAFGKCRTWFTSEPAELAAAIANVSCPTELSVARSDPGWFLKADYLAGIPSGRKPLPQQECYYSAIEDVPAKLHAAPASLCCYRISDSGLLMKEFVSKENPLAHGSSVLRSHPFGSDHHNEHYLPGHVPYLSHWYWDIMPYMQCCVWWTGNACINLYHKRRPPPQMKKKPPGSQAAYVYGSTVRPFGDKPPASAFCNKPGEYWLVHSKAISVQIRYYVVSEYTGPKPVPKPTHLSLFKPAGSRSVLVTALAIVNSELPNRVVEIICAEGEYRAYIQVADSKEKPPSIYELKAGGGVGTKILVSDSVVQDGNRVVSILARHSAGRIGITAYIPHPGEEFMNLFVTVTPDLFRNVTGLAKEGSQCGAHKIKHSWERLFTEMCQHCNDFNKYYDGRPLYFEDYDGPEHLKTITSLDPNCKGDTTCEYMVWSTNYMDYFEEAHNSKTKHIDQLMPKVGYTGMDVCQRPNISGLSILETQTFTDSSTMQLTCMKPFSSSANNAMATCRNSQNGLEFSVPKDFICAESAEFTQSEKTAAAADEKYAKEHYSPESATKRCSTIRSSLAISNVLLSTIGIWILLSILNSNDLN